MIYSSRFGYHGKQAIAEVIIYILGSLKMSFIVQQVDIKVAQDLNTRLFMLLIALNLTKISVSLLFEDKLWIM